jgi:hypothetical protein
MKRWTIIPLRIVLMLIILEMRVFERILDSNHIQPIYMKLRNKRKDVVDSKTIYNNFNVFKVESTIRNYF